MSTDLIVITGPTATGKTRTAALLAHKLDAEIISADSRQVYRGMDIGTGKDMEDYIVEGKEVPVHLVDIADPGYEFNVFEFQKAFLNAFEDIRKRKKQAILAGGTGMYIEAVLAGYRMLEVPENTKLRNDLADLEMGVLQQKLAQLRPLHNTSDTADRQRLVRAIEIELYNRAHADERANWPEFKSRIFAVRLDRDTIRQRITARLHARLKEGMIDEIHTLLKNHQPDELRFYGLEYRYLTDYAQGILTYDQMFAQLNTAIHQFAKRQMTWFRRMERKGFQLEWIDGRMTAEERTAEICKMLDKP